MKRSRACNWNRGVGRASDLERGQESREIANRGQIFEGAEAQQGVRFHGCCHANCSSRGNKRRKIGEDVGNRAEAAGAILLHVFDAIERETCGSRESRMRCDSASQPPPSRC